MQNFTRFSAISAKNTIHLAKTSLSRSFSSTRATSFQSSELQIPNVSKTPPSPPKSNSLEKTGTNFSPPPKTNLFRSQHSKGKTKKSVLPSKAGIQSWQYQVEDTTDVLTSNRMPWLGGPAVHSPVSGGSTALPGRVEASKCHAFGNALTPSSSTGVLPPESP